MSIALTSNAAYRFNVFFRVLAASLGGYVLVNITSVAFSLMLPIKDDYIAFLVGIQSNFLIYSIVIIWAFAARTAIKAWLGLLIVGLPLALISWYLGAAV